MQTHFGPDFFTANRDRLRQSIDSTIPIIITGNGVMQRGGDEPSPFHQDSSFWYLTGISAADLVLVIDERESYLIIPGLSATQEAFDGAHDTAAYAARSGIASVLTERDGWNRLGGILQSGQAASLLSPPSYLKRHGLHTLPYRRRLITKLKRLNPKLHITDLRPSLAAMRSIKRPEELRALQQAIDITCDTLRDITLPANLHSVTKEYEFEAALTFGFRMRGAAGHAFAPIVGAGQHSTTLHYLRNDGPVGSDDVVVLDVGAEVEHYAADISRTISRRPMTGRAAAVFRAVEAVQDYALSQIRPGVLARDYEQLVEGYMGEQLQRLRLIQTADRESIRRYFPHATSHFLGLDTHDVGDYLAPWQENMVITCEPGIYIPEEGIGVRIEDDVLITADGNRVLSKACPRALTPVQ